MSEDEKLTQGEAPSSQTLTVDLLWRTVSTVFYGPIVIALIFWSHLSVVVLAFLIGVLLTFEWHRMVLPNATRVLRLTSIAVYLGAAAVALVLFCFGLPQEGLGVILLATLGLAWRVAGEPRGRFLVFGVPYLIAPCVLFVWLRGDLDFGQETALWLLAVVWAYDTGAYLTGTFVGGPTFFSHISPNKTWSGVVGGTICAGIAGVAVGAVIGSVDLTKLGLLSAVLGLIGQLGDLIESALKRYFDVKDSGGLIPGHGGVLDRMDSVITVIVAVAFMTALFGGHSIIWS